MMRTDPALPNDIFLQALARDYPNRDAVFARIALLRASLTLPKPVVHVISDVHGEAEKLRHVVNNGSGGLRALAAQLFAAQFPDAELSELLNFIYYPRESWAAHADQTADSAARRALVDRLVRREVELLRVLARRYDVATMERVLPAAYASLFIEWIFAHELQRPEDFCTSTLADFAQRGGELELLRCLARSIRNLFVRELIIAGDLGDRGSRIDSVIGFIMHQPNVAITWGNHDASWMGACLGQPACIATVIRMSVRHGRVAQLEQGYGIPLAPLEELVDVSYADDPAHGFACSGVPSRDDAMLRRMQKAIAILQFKLEAQAIRRNPQWGMDGRDLLRFVDIKKKTVEIAGEIFALNDWNFPTVDSSNPSVLSAAEERCLAQVTESFLHSPILWEQMDYVARQGAMWLRRDRALIFHGCVPVDTTGNFLPLDVLGKTVAGRALFEAFDDVVRRAFREKDPRCLDLLWYLWAGALSPVFGKDKIATFENYFVDDKPARAETKNPYFHLINETQFCRRILREFDVDEVDGLIVNGHVPVKIDAGESPVKASGQAVTIDGAFSEVYGDHGYTLVLESDRTILAQHHHFESVAEAISHGADIVPTLRVIQQFDPSRTVADTERGAEITEEIGALESLLIAFDDNRIEATP